jgi:hypothetical protein
MQTTTDIRRGNMTPKWSYQCPQPSFAVLEGDSDKKRAEIMKFLMTTDKPVTPIDVAQIMQLSEHETAYHLDVLRGSGRAVQASRNGIWGFVVKNKTVTIHS